MKISTQRVFWKRSRKENPDVTFTPQRCVYNRAAKCTFSITLVSLPSTSTKRKIVRKFRGVIVTQTSILESLLHETLSRATSRYLKQVNVDKIAKKRISTCVENSK